MASITRRALFAQGGLITAGTMLPGHAAARRIDHPPGVQLWTVKEDLARDFDGTLRALARLGYRRVESAGWHDRTPAQFRSALEAARLDCTAAHYSLRDLIDDTDGCLAVARDVGVRYVIASSPAPARALDTSKPWSTAVAEAMTLADWRSNVEAMDRIGRRARALGLRFGYHNHSAEFLAYDRRLPMEEIVRLTDPANVVLELDIGWVAGAGYDPVEAIERFRSRIHLLHVKDLATRERIPGRMVTDERTTPIGSGSIDWPAVFRAAARAPIHGYFVEQEAPFTEPPLAALGKSIAYLRNLSI